MFGFLEYVAEESADWYVENNYNSLYVNADGDNALLYGPIMYVNHQPWGSTFIETENDSDEDLQLILCERWFKNTNKY